MRISTLAYCIKQGMINICRNILFSLASMATISACIFLFCLFFAIAANVRSVTLTAQNTLGITVFFDEDLSDDEILALGKQIGAWGEVRAMEFTSGEEAWESFRQVYFGEDEELAAGFEEDNPLATSSSYTIYLNQIEDQAQVAARLQAMEGVRRVNSSDTAAMGLSNAGKLAGLLSLVVIAVLLGVAVFLISNTISVAAAFRRRENEIMRLIGATNFMIRAPFVVEGVILGLAGALLPLGGMYVLYGRTAAYLTSHFRIVTDVFQPLKLELLFPYMAAVALGLGVGIGFVVSFFTIRRHLRI